MVFSLFQLVLEKSRDLIAHQLHIPPLPIMANYSLKYQPKLILLVLKMPTIKRQTQLRNGILNFFWHDSLQKYEK